MYSIHNFIAIIRRKYFYFLNLIYFPVIVFPFFNLSTFFKVSVESFRHILDEKVAEEYEQVSEHIQVQDLLLEEHSRVFIIQY